MNITIRPSVSEAIRAASLPPAIVAGLVEQWLMISGIPYAEVAPVYSPAGQGLAGAVATVRHPSLRGEHGQVLNDYIAARIAEVAAAGRAGKKGAA